MTPTDIAAVKARAEALRSRAALARAPSTSAETEAAVGEADRTRLDWMISTGARISWSRDSECCNVWLPSEYDGTPERPAEGYPQKIHIDARSAIDAAMRARRP